MACSQGSKGERCEPVGVWDRAFYEGEHGQPATDQFRGVVEALAKLTKSQGWDLSYILNKHYVAFKLGHRVVFIVNWTGPNTWNLELKLPKAKAQASPYQDWEFQRYDDGWKSAIFRPRKSGSLSVAELEPLLVAAHKHVAGI